MKWCTYISPADGRPRTGLLDPSGTLILGHAPGISLLQLLESGDLSGAAAQVLEAPFEEVPIEDVQLCAPIVRPPSIRDFMSFEDHLRYSADAMGVAVPEIWYQRPMFYFTNPAALLGPRDPVRMPRGTSALDYELEVGIVVGKSAADVGVAEAADCIAGYLIFCDWSARDVQRAEMPLMIGPSKSKDFASSVSGFLVTPDEIASAWDGERHHLTMEAFVNGVSYSSGTLADLHWSFAEMVAAASENTVLHPGDVIASGTVGGGCILELAGRYGADRYPYLAPGDLVRLQVEGLGELEVEVIADTSAG